MTSRAMSMPAKPQNAVPGVPDEPPATFRVKAGDDRRSLRNAALAALHGGRRVVILASIDAEAASLAARIDPGAADFVLVSAHSRFKFPDARDAVAHALGLLDEQFGQQREFRAAGQGR